MTFLDGSTKEGDWKNGVLVKGRFKTRELEYEGEFNDKEVFQGKGKATYADGSVYEGDWKDGKYNGKGKLTSRGNSYEGSFKVCSY